MKNLVLVLALLLGTTAMAQQTNPKAAWLEKWNNSRDYLIQMVEAMPEANFDFKPTERQKTFAEQLEHMAGNINWLSSAYFNGQKAEFATEGSKQDMIASLQQTFDQAYKAVEATPEAELAEIVEFFAGPKSKWQMMNLLQDHLTHHRGQIIVYLNLNGVEPPRYVGW